jgi:hypothetical protein
VHTCKETKDQSEHLMREIVIQTETTGLDPSNRAHRRDWAVELINRSPTGNMFHCSRDAEDHDHVGGGGGVVGARETEGETRTRPSGSRQRVEGG